MNEYCLFKCYSSDMYPNCAKTYLPIYDNSYMFLIKRITLQQHMFLILGKTEATKGMKI